MSKGFVDYYSILEIDPTNDIKLIKKAYKKVAKKNHPDINGTGDDTQFKIIQDAYEVLKNEKTLNKYYEYYNKQKEKEKNNDYLEFRKKYEEYVVDKKVKYEKKTTTKKTKKNKLNVFINNFKKNNYALNIAKVAGMTTAVIVAMNIVGIKKENNNVQEAKVTQNITTEINESNLTYELIRNYEVQKGDTLYDISRDIGTSVERIKEINSLNDNTIYFDKTIKLPYEVQSKDLVYYTQSVEVENNSIYNLADEYNTTTETIYNLNKEAIKVINGNYYVLSETLKMPKFITIEEKEALINTKNCKVFTK